MRVLLTAHPGVGHVLPVLAVALQLQKRGHTVALASGPRFRRFIEERAVSFYPAGLDWSQSEVGEPAAWTMIVRESPPRFVKDLLDIAHSFAPELLVREETEYSAYIAADALGLPCATLGLGGNLVAGGFRGEVEELIQQLRRELGAGSDPGLKRLHHFLYLDPYPEGWVPPSRLPADVSYAVGVGPTVPLSMAAAEHPTADWHEAGIYATLGTVHHRQPDLVRAIIAALGTLGRPSLVALGPGVDIVGFDTPANVRLCGTVAQDEVLSRCVLAISHAGTGTALGALRQGVPQLLIPIQANQGWVAQLADGAGVARLLLGDEPRLVGPMGKRADLSSITGADIMAAAEEVLVEPSYALRAREAASELRRRWESETAGQLLERLGETKQPVTEFRLQA